jgi:nucleoside-diphosphate-sugar epimerase
MTRALVTGAGGFIGSALCDELVRLAWQVRAVSRGEPTSADRSVIFCEDLAVIPPEHLDDWLDGVDVVFHLAGRAHRNDKGTERERYERYRHDNVATTRSLFAAAQRNSVGRFIFISSIKVLGDVSDAPLRPDDDPDPQDVYAQTKLEAERSLEDARHRGRTRVTIVRPPLVYGPGVKGNFASLFATVAHGWPLPLGRADAPRSLLARANLVDLLIAAVRDSADWRVLHARDDGDGSVRDLVATIARAFGKGPRLVPVPRILMRAAAAMTGRRAVYERLFEPLVVDDDETRQALDWSPPQSRGCAIEEVSRWWQAQR